MSDLVKTLAYFYQIPFKIKLDNFLLNKVFVPIFIIFFCIGPYIVKWKSWSFILKVTLINQNKAISAILYCYYRGERNLDHVSHMGDGYDERIFHREKKFHRKKRLFICTTNVLLHLSCESSRVAGDNVYLTTLRLTLKFQCLWNRPWHKRRILTNIDKIQVRAFLYVFIGQIKRVKLEVRHWNKA